MGMTIDSVRTLLGYNDAANQMVFDAAIPLSDEALDREFPMGRGSLRRTLLHIWAGESAWLSRWKGVVETPWPNENDPIPVSEVQSWIGDARSERDEFIGGLTEADLQVAQKYRDSKGELFEATLGEMLLQGFIHSTHHRAQAVNMLRNVDAGLVELDYMGWVRRPVAS